MVRARRAKIQGFHKFYIAIRHLGHVIENYFGDGGDLGVEIRYLKELSPLGTAGALSLIQPFPQDSVLITNGDILTDVNFGDLLDFHSHNQAAATMAVQVHELQHPFGVFQTNGIEITSHEEKRVLRTLINAGVYVLEPKVISLLTKNEAIDMPTLFEFARQREFSVVAYLLHEQWADIGSHKDLDCITSLYIGKKHHP